MFFRLSFVTLIFALSAFGTPIKRDVTQVESDVKALDTQTNMLNEAINSLPDSNATLAQAQAIHDQAMELGTAIQGATTNLMATSPFDNSQAATMLGETQQLTDDIVNGLKDLDDKKNTIDALWLNGIVAEDLVSLDTDTKVFGDQYMTKIPTSKAKTVQEQMDTIVAAFQTSEQTFDS
ncbi:hydrophobic surface binding protein A-domain-containing protein [Butyriboletus roseoflavus]|nr:hydrophobic surface binding protein A-domain-containing protein [Butyriboletus roseoflavus]